MNLMKKLVILLCSAALILSACNDKTPSVQTYDDEIESSVTVISPERKEFIFTEENFPKMDGSTSTVPLAEAVACVLLGKSREQVSDLVLFNKTTQSLRNLAAGLCDIIIVSEPSPNAFDELSDQGFEYEIAPIAIEALVFIVNADNPVNNLTAEQIRKIYTGEITNWSEVGGDDIDIVAFQRDPEAGSQVLMDKLLMQGYEMMSAPRERVLVAYSMGMLIDNIKGFDGSANALGYTMYYYAEDMKMAQGLKMLSVEGVAPDVNSIKTGEYPFLNPYFAIIGKNEPEDSPARILFNWLLTSQGQALIDNEGYVSVKN